MKTVKPILIYNLAEMPRGLELKDVIRRWKEDGIVLVDTFERNHPEFLHSHIEHMVTENKS